MLSDRIYGLLSVLLAVRAYPLAAAGVTSLSLGGDGFVNRVVP